MMMYWCKPTFGMWCQSLSHTEIVDLKNKYKEYDKPLYKA
jgi:hypothetical protein